jgi:alpha-galactosidase
VTDDSTSLPDATPEPAASSPTIVPLNGAIDGFSVAGSITGWVVGQQTTHYVAALRLELRRGDTVLAQTAPNRPRPDVTRDDHLPAGFSFDWSGVATAQELLDGIVGVFARDGAGQVVPILFYGPTAQLARQAIARGRSTSPAAPPAAAATGRPEQAFPGQRLFELIDEKPARRRITRAAAGTGPRITFIGAGSTVFAKNLLGDILSFEALGNSRICLYDIDPERLRVSEVVARRIAAALGSGATIVATTDLSRALDGADFAINMVQVGGYKPCTVTDFEIPNRFGLRQTIADTLGIGGIMRALRTIPVLLGMAREMERLCPDVLHLNYVNPMAMNCWALSRASRIRTVGLCHSVQGTAAELAADIGVPVEEIDYQVAGINHMAFYLRFRRKGTGEDLYPLIRKVDAEGRMPQHNRVRYDVLRRLGWFVTESSEHFAEYVPWYIKNNRRELINRFNIPLDEYPRRCELQIRDWQELGRELQDPSRPIQVVRSHEYGAGIINAIRTGEPTVIYGNVMNEGGLIENLPAESCVEVPCLVDGNGLQPVRVGRIPLQLAALMQTNINVQGLAVEAALTGSREHVYHAAMLDPHTAAELDLDQIHDLVDALLRAHRDWLPATLLEGLPPGARPAA